jgi:hypothetical protein
VGPEAFWRELTGSPAKGARHDYEINDLVPRRESGSRLSLEKGLPSGEAFRFATASRVAL